MRKGVAITLVVLAVALFPAISLANSPIFIGVPGMINISDEEVDGTFAFDDVFGMTLDEAVYDADTADSALTWTFDDASGVIEINGFTAASGTNLRVDGTSTFDIEYTDLSGGVATGLDTQFAGTNAEALVAAADAGTLINLHVSDGTFMTSKEILVLATDGGTDAAGGVYGEQVTYSTGAGHSMWRYFDEVIEGSASGQVLDISDSRGLTVQATAPDDGVSIYFGYAIGPRYNEAGATPVTVQKGKVYRTSTMVYPGNTAGGYPCRFRLRCGTIGASTWDLQTMYENQGIAAGGFGGQNLRVPSAAGTGYENYFCPPQADRFSAMAYGDVAHNFRLMYDVIDVFGYSWMGELVFGNTVVDEFDRPELGSNGFLMAWGSSGLPYDWVPIVEIGTLSVLGVEGAPGWRYEALHFEGSVAQRHQAHTELGISGVNDSVTSASVSSDRTQLRLFGAVSGFNMPYWFIGEPAGNGGASVNDFHYNSAIPYDLIEEWSNTVVYRATFTLSGDDDVYTNNPAVRLRFGLPWGVSQAGMAIGDGTYTQAGPDTTPTDYEVWWLGPDAAKADSTKEVLDNVSLTIDMLDFGNTTGGSVYVDDIKVEVFPRDFFN